MFADTHPSAGGVVATVGTSAPRSGDAGSTSTSRIGEDLSAGTTFESSSAGKAPSKAKYATGTVVKPGCCIATCTSGGMVSRVDGNGRPVRSGVPFLVRRRSDG